MCNNAIALYEIILTSTQEGIIAVDILGNHTFVNPAAAKMLGHDAESLIGLNSHDTWHYAKKDGSIFPREECQIYAAYKDGKIHRSSDEVFWRKDGTSFQVEYASTPIIENNIIIGAVVIFSNITERMQAEKELLQAYEQIKTLRGVLPICANCKKIRDKDGKWISIEVYIRDRTGAEFSHGICPKCSKELYPEEND